MYHTLFNQITDVIAALQAVQQKTEEMHISQPREEEAETIGRDED
jgi:hypothetical protein